MARKEKQYHFIYKTTCLLNGKYYYGMHSTDNPNDGYYGSGRRLRRSLNKYGKENHKVEIVEYLPNRKSLIEREKEIVNLNEIVKNECLNLMIGGEGGFISEEQQKYRSSCAGKAYAEKLKIDTEFRNKMSIIRSNTMKKIFEKGIYPHANSSRFTNKSHSEKTKLIMSEKHKGMGVGKNNSQYGTCWITNGISNKKIKKCNITKYVNSEWKLGRIT
jgi:hypothetical protein